jgi:hypothetical protein
MARVPSSFDARQAREFPAKEEEGEKKASGQSREAGGKVSCGWQVATDGDARGKISGILVLAPEAGRVMNGAKLILSAGICLGVASAMVSGCGSSSAGPTGPDSSVAPDAQGVDAGIDSGSLSCNPFAVELCPQGQTCCFAGLRGTCTDTNACSTPFHIGCVNTASCGSGQVCCGAIVPPGFDASAFADASFDASAFDASAFDASGFDASGFVVTLACASSCPLFEFQACMSNDDCPSGFVCGGGAGTAGGNPNFGLILACVPADAGSPPAPDASPDSAADAGAADGDAG